MSLTRKNQKQIWSDPDFAKRLARIKAMRELTENPVRNLAELTKEMLKCPSFEKLERELMELDKRNIQLRIKIDAKELFK